VTVDKDRGHPYHSSKLHPGPCSSVGMWRGTDTQTDTCDGRRAVAKKSAKLRVRDKIPEESTLIFGDIRVPL